MVASEPTAAGRLLDHYAAEIARFPLGVDLTVAQGNRLVQMVATARDRLTKVEQERDPLNNVNDLVAGRNASGQTAAAIRRKPGPADHRGPRSPDAAGRTRSPRPCGRAARPRLAMSAASPRSPWPAGRPGRPRPEGPAGRDGRASRADDRTQSAGRASDRSLREQGHRPGRRLRPRRPTGVARQRDRAEFVTRSIGEGSTSSHAEARLLRILEAMIEDDPAWREARAQHRDQHLGESLSELHRAARRTPPTVPGEPPLRHRPLGEAAPGQQPHHGVQTSADSPADSP